jgi:CRISPR-associated protein Csm2
MRIDFNDKTELFNEVAEHWANEIKMKKTTSTQLRNYYDKVLELYEKSKYLTNEEFNDKVLPFVKMLNAKVSYGVGRGVVSRKFQEMMKICINQVNNKKDLEIFKYFFEAVIGFYKGVEK